MSDAVAFAYSIGPDGGAVPLSESDLAELNASYARQLGAAMRQKSEAANISPQKRAMLERRWQQWRREDIIRRCCAQVALSRINKVLGVK